tara:strand:- start:375 stop:542 length:168 start_codon:yes stop_codon:yes gene_type:complete
MSSKKYTSISKLKVKLHNINTDITDSIKHYDIENINMFNLIKLPKKNTPSVKKSI